MRSVQIKDSAHNYGAPEHWDATRDGECGVLSVRVQEFGANKLRECVSAWRPTSEELALLVRGGVVILSIIGGQPPVMLTVEGPQS